jgi:elongation factor 1-gamma
MSSNQVGGFFNRLDASRKYLFGSVGVLGASNDSVISGAFILRGQDVKGVIDVAPDWESYTYTRLDVDDPAQKAFFEAALAWDLEIDGKKWADGKNVSAGFLLLSLCSRVLTFYLVGTVQINIWLCLRRVEGAFD